MYEFLIQHFNIRSLVQKQKRKQFVLYLGIIRSDTVLNPIKRLVYSSPRTYQSTCELYKLNLDPNFHHIQKKYNVGKLT